MEVNANITENVMSPPNIFVSKDSDLMYVNGSISPIQCNDHVDYIFY